MLYLLLLLFSCSTCICAMRTPTNVPLANTPLSLNSAPVAYEQTGAMPEVYQNYANVNIQQHSNANNLEEIYENNRVGRQYVQPQAANVTYPSEGPDIFSPGTPDTVGALGYARDPLAIHRRAGTRPFPSLRQPCEPCPNNYFPSSVANARIPPYDGIAYAGSTYIINTTARTPNERNPYPFPNRDNVPAGSSKVSQNIPCNINCHTPQTHPIQDGYINRTSRRPYNNIHGINAFYITRRPSPPTNYAPISPPTNSVADYVAPRGEDYAGTTIHGTPYIPHVRGYGNTHGPPLGTYQYPIHIVPQNYYSGKQTRAVIPSAAYSQCPSMGNGQFPYEHNCYQFLNCWNGRGVVQNCPPGTLFNALSLVCDFPEKVTCISGPRSAKLTLTNLSEKQQANCPSEFSGIIPHYNDCSRFISCDGGRQHDMSCPPGTFFDVRTNICDHAYKVICANGQSEQLKHVTNSYTIQQQRQQQQQPSLQAHSYSNQQLFGGFRTSHGVGQPPSENTEFVYSAQTHTDMPINGKIVQHGADCPQFYSGLLPHPTDCSKFVNCANGIAHIQNCGSNTLFNPLLKVCDYAHLVQCHTIYNNHGIHQRPTPPQYGQPSPTPSSPSGTTTARWPPAGSPISRPGRNPNGIFLVSETGPLSSGLPPSHGKPINHYMQWAVTTPQVRPVQTVENPWTTPPNTDDVIEHVTTNYETLTAASTSYKSRQWPPPFPATDLNADYVFEYEDLFVEPEWNAKKPDSSNSEAATRNWCARKDAFECGNKICIAPSSVCNGQEDCLNGADEIFCDYILNSFLKTPSTKLAVREINKLQNITLPWCAQLTYKTNGKSFNYRAHDGTCYILDSNVGLSGALIMLPLYDYYENRKFTLECPNIGGYLCTNRKCIDKSKICDGVNDCGDGFDEKGCTADAFDYKIRLVGGKNKNSGRIEVEAFGKAGFVCDDMFGLKNADVVCRELGFALGAAEVRGNSYFAQDIKDNDTLYIMDDVTCMGNETTLRDCDFSGWENSNCQPGEIVGIVCKTPMEICAKNQWTCNNSKECLPLAFVCDGVYDCSDKSDESTELCQTPMKVRLSDGNKGRVEVMHNGIWGTICDDDFNDDAAKVVCRQLGHNGSARVKKEAFFGSGVGPIWLDQVFCHGNETSLDECVHWDWGEHNCEHDEDVGVVCTNVEDPGEARHSKNIPQELVDEMCQVSLPAKCGLRSDALFNSEEEEDPDIHFRVVQASLARVGEYPWQASIRVQGKTKASHWCGAIVISAMHILTAAHCLTGFSKGAYYVVAGDYNTDKIEGTEQVAFIEDFVLHPEFGQGNKMNNDIAVIRLKGRGFKLSKDVQAICLPPAIEDYPIGLNCTISGFGSIESGKSKASTLLRAGWVPILSKEVCAMPHIYGASITGGMLCAGFLDNGVDACDGDSGGPMACLHEGVFKLFGITSWGQHCGYANKPGVYVNVGKYRGWIEEIINKFKC